MFPRFVLAGFEVPTFFITVAVFSAVVIIHLRFFARDLAPMSAADIIRYIVLPLPLAWFSARLFYLGVETREQVGEAWLVELLRVNGRVFYGALFGFIASFWFLLRSKPEVERVALWRAACEIGGLGYLIFRVHCLAVGCCYGRLTTVPWAVVYEHGDSLMPYLGVPVHPVQIYDALLGGFIFLVCRFERTEFPLALFLSIYAAGRLVTECFRGDIARGANFLWHFSIAQTFSIAILCLIILWGFRFNGKLWKWNLA